MPARFDLLGVDVAGEGVHGMWWLLRRTERAARSLKRLPENLSPVRVAREQGALSEV